MDIGLDLLVASDLGPLKAPYQGLQTSHWIFLVQSAFSDANLEINSSLNFSLSAQVKLELQANSDGLIDQFLEANQH